MKLRSPILLTAFALAGACASAFAASLESFTTLSEGKTIVVPIGQIEGVRFNDVCLKNEAHCEALKKYRNPEPIKPRLPSDAGSYPAKFCNSLGGTQLILTTPKQAGALFCVFQDLTMVDAGALLARDIKGKKR